MQRESKRRKILHITTASKKRLCSSRVYNESKRLKICHTNIVGVVQKDILYDNLLLYFMSKIGHDKVLVEHLTELCVRSRQNGFLINSNSFARKLIYFTRDVLLRDITNLLPNYIFEQGTLQQAKYSLQDLVTEIVTQPLNLASRQELCKCADTLGFQSYTIRNPSSDINGSYSMCVTRNKIVDVLNPGAVADRPVFYIS